LAPGWANDVCSTSKLFCQHPEYLAYAGGVLLVIAVGFKLGSIAAVARAPAPFILFSDSIFKQQPHNSLRHCRA
jgi:hypothetical protein